MPRSSCIVVFIVVSPFRRERTRVCLHRSSMASTFDLCVGPKVRNTRPAAHGCARTRARGGALLAWANPQRPAIPRARGGASRQHARRTRAASRVSIRVHRAGPLPHLLRRLTSFCRLSCETRVTAAAAGSLGETQGLLRQFRGIRRARLLSPLFGESARLSARRQTPALWCPPNMASAPCSRPRACTAAGTG